MKAVLVALSVVFCLLSTKAQALFDPVKAQEKASDIAILIDSTVGLLEEFNHTSEVVEKLLVAERELRLLRDDMALLQEITDEADYLTNPQAQRLQNLHRKIDFLARYIRRAKRFVLLMKSVQPSGQGATAATLLRTNGLLLRLVEQQETKDVQKEIDNIRSSRKKVKARVAYKKAKDRELEYIENHSRKRGN